MSTKTKIQSRHKIIFDREDEIMCAVLAAQGKSFKYIASVTGLSIGAASYRARKAGISPRDWRNGTGEYTQQLEHTLTNVLKRQLGKELKRKFRE